MTDQQMIDLAMRISVDVHAGQKDRYGEIYIFHPMRVMMKLYTVDDKCVAILHDVVEDSDWTVEDLSREGFPQNIIEAIDAVSKREDEPYMEYIHRLASNEMAMRVKLADLEDNMDLRRVNDTIKKADLQRFQRYREAYTFLNLKLNRRPCLI